MKLFFLISIFVCCVYAAEEPMNNEYRDELRDVRSDSSSDSSSDSAEQIHVPQIGFKHPKLHVSHHKHHKHGGGADDGHIMASWHHGDGHDKSNSESEEEVPILEKCTCKELTMVEPTTINPWWYQSKSNGSSWYDRVKRSFYDNNYITFYSGFRLKGEKECFCPELHQITQRTINRTQDRLAE